MEYVLSALILHKLGKDVNEDNVTKVLKAAGASIVDAKVKALVASLADVDIQKAIEEAAMAPVAAVAVAPHGEAKAEHHEKKEEKSEADKAKDAEKATAGLGSLFG